MCILLIETLSDFFLMKNGNFSYRRVFVTKNCLSQVLEDSGTGSDPDITCLYKIFLERSISYVITQIRNCVKLLNLALYRSF